ncbi:MULTISPECIES: DegV family protein [unclassified Vagococcus]|uniref:DegV family protein n=1 Tax=unclassified Vagococcus TaxID=2648499 RepID=UPI001F5115C5|nr:MULTISPECIES: DegV family protein [unclassified Vagococcus]MCI0129673.1 DegV family protein [Vagococcus sp. CY53-2]UNM90317.1 DegV family protein [Vagococcus sp. CY52-2]
MKIAIVTDSTAYIQEQYQNHKNLFVLSVPLIIDDVVYQEGIDITDEAFYEKLKVAKEFPKTSQPALGEVYELYETLAKSGYDAVISIHLSTGISGFITTLNGISKDFSDIDIYPFDSYITSGPMGRMVEVALEMTEHKEANPKEMIQHLEEMRRFAEGYIVVDDLNHLVRGGRLKNGAAIIGTLLKIKPILRFQDGDIILSEKIRSQKKALSRVIDIVLEEVPSKPHDSMFYVIHCNNIEVAEHVKEDMLKRDSQLEVILCDFGPVIGTHLGEKSIGIGVIPKK